MSEELKRGHLVSLTTTRAISLIGVCLLFGCKPVSEWPSACHRGAYQLADGRLMTVSHSPVAALNIDLNDGTRVMTWGSENRFSGTACIGSEATNDDFVMEANGCPASRLSVSTHDAPEQSAERMPIYETEASFKSNGLNLRAKLFEPNEDRRGTLIILPADRDGYSRLDWGSDHYMLTALGFSVFVYEKPENWLASPSGITSDEEAKTYAVAALAKARTLLRSPAAEIGFYGNKDALLVASSPAVNFAITNSEVLPIGLLQEIDVPILWLLPSNRGGSAKSVIETLNETGKQITLITLPSVDENAAWYEMRNGSKCHITKPPDYWRKLQGWVNNLTTS